MLPWQLVYWCLPNVSQIALVSENMLQPPNTSGSRATKSLLHKAKFLYTIKYYVFDLLINFIHHHCAIVFYCLKRISCLIVVTIQ